MSECSSVEMAERQFKCHLVPSRVFINLTHLQICVVVNGLPTNPRTYFAPREIQL
jgi:hypothetical protein